jgi:hypothetical protein
MTVSRSLRTGAALLGAALVAAALHAGPAALAVAEASFPASAATTAASTAGADSLAALVQPLLATVESLRGHVFRHPVPVHVVTDSTASVYFRDRLQRELPAALLHAQTVAYERLGLLPDSTDVTAMLLGLMEEQAGGYYSPEVNAFFVLADMPRPVLPIIAVHELTHALDDQYFAIDSLIAAQNHDSDREAAVGGVVEGSGTLVMQVFAVTELQSGRLSLDALQEFAQSDAARAERFQAAPAVVRRSLLAPYLLGSSFLLRGDPLRVADGVPRADLDRAFSTPPVRPNSCCIPRSIGTEPAPTRRAPSGCPI